MFKIGLVQYCINGYTCSRYILTLSSVKLNFQSTAVETAETVRLFRDVSRVCVTLSTSLTRVMSMMDKSWVLRVGRDNVFCFRIKFYQLAAQFRDRLSTYVCMYACTWMESIETLTEFVRALKARHRRSRAKQRERERESI